MDNFQVSFGHEWKAALLVIAYCPGSFSYQRYPCQESKRWTFPTPWRVFSTANRITFLQLCTRGKFYEVTALPGGLCESARKSLSSAGKVIRDFRNNSCWKQHRPTRWPVVTTITLQSTTRWSLTASCLFTDQLSLPFFLLCYVLRSLQSSLGLNTKTFFFFWLYSGEDHISSNGGAKTMASSSAYRTNVGLVVAVAFIESSGPISQSWDRARHARARPTPAQVGVALSLFFRSWPNSFLMTKTTESIRS